MPTWRLVPAAGSDGTMKVIDVPADGTAIAVGRGALTGVHDKSVSRAHLRIRRADDDGGGGVEIAALGMNPCAVLRAGSASAGEEPLKKGDAAVVLRAGDRISLLVQGRFAFVAAFRADAADREAEQKATPPVAAGESPTKKRGLQQRTLKRARSSFNELDGLADYAASFAAPAPAPAVVVPEESDVRVVQLAEMFPDASPEKLRSALKKSGSLEGAASALVGSPEKAKPTSPPTPLERLQGVFPTADPSLLEGALKSCGGNVDKAAAWLLGDGAGAAWAAPPPARRLDFGYGGHSGYSGEEEEEEEEEEDEGGSSCDEYDSGEEDEYDSGEYDDYGGPGGAVSLPHGAERIRVLIDMGKPAQSLVRLRRDPVAVIKRDSMQFGDLAQYAALCFQTMIEREQEFFGDFFCLYHSYSFASLLYEVQAEIARAIWELPDDFAPLPRLLCSPYHDLPTMDMLLHEFDESGERDHASKYRALAISASCTLFASSSEAPPTAVFKGGYSCADLSFRGLLLDVLRACKLQESVVEDLADEIVSLGLKYKLPVSMYKAHHHGAFGGGFAMDPGEFGAEATTGHLLQIFIHKDELDELAYSSHAYGVPTKRGKLSELLRHGNTGQARLFCIPQVLTDPKKCRLVHYCADANLACTDPDTPGSRGAFIRELRATLDPILGNYAMLRKAYRSVTGIPPSASQQDQA